MVRSACPDAALAPARILPAAERDRFPRVRASASAADSPAAHPHRRLRPFPRCAATIGHRAVASSRASNRPIENSMKTSVLTLLAIAFFAASQTLGASAQDAPPATVQWAAEALGPGGTTTRPTNDAPILIVKRQDHGELGLARSVM